VLVRPHVANRQPGFDLARNPGLLQADHPTLGFTDAQQQNGCRVILTQRQLVARDQRDSAPSDEGGTEKRYLLREVTPRRVAFRPKAAMAFGMGEEERRLFPNERQQFIEIVREWERHDGS